MSGNEPMTKIVGPLRSGQITIPVEFRKRLGIDQDTLLRLTRADGELRIKPVQVAEEPTGSPWLKELYENFAPVRQEAIEKGYTEEVNATSTRPLRRCAPSGVAPEHEGRLRHGHPRARADQPL
jgi:bifunctional DNA-binding transcriptional regulator/antitoxin component of YhaV-PrlF toxin-antitoxin module